MIDKQSVVLPDASGPNTSIILPLGTPPIPNAISRAMDPVGITSIPSLWVTSPSFIMEPRPYCFSICSIASRIACNLGLLDEPFGDFVWEFFASFMDSYYHIRGKIQDKAFAWSKGTLHPSKLRFSGSSLPVECADGVRVDGVQFSAPRPFGKLRVSDLMVYDSSLPKGPDPSMNSGSP